MTTSYENAQKKVFELNNKLEDQSNQVRLYKAILFGFVLFCIFLAVLCEIDRRKTVLLNGQIVTYKWQIDSLENVIECKDIFIEENTFFKNLTGKEKKERAKTWTKKRHEAGIFIE